MTPTYTLYLRPPIYQLWDFDDAQICHLPGPSPSHAMRRYSRSMPIEPCKIYDDQIELVIVEDGLPLYNSEHVR